jgi:hypothetical protein
MLIEIPFPWINRRPILLVQGVIIIIDSEISRLAMMEIPSFDEGAMMPIPPYDCRNCHHLC